MNGTETLTPAMLDALRQTKPWARFLSIVGFVVVALMIAAGIGVAAVGVFMEGASRRGLFYVLPVLYIVLGVLYFFPALYLFRYAGAIGDALALPSKSEAVERALRLQKSFWKFMGILAMVMMLFYIPGIFASIAIPNLLTAQQHSRQKRTMADVRSVATAVEAYATDHNSYPRATNLDELARELEPMYIKTIPRVDAWGVPLVYEVEECSEERCTSYFVASGGKDGKLDRDAPSEYAADGFKATSNFNDDIVFSDGNFLRAPEGVSSGR
jgi:type II secretory pathway pseudopilin PulG